MSFKIVKSTLKTNKDGLSVYDFKLKLPKKYWQLSQEEIDFINVEHVKPMDPFMLKKEKRTVYLIGFEISKKKINKEKAIEKVKERFWKAMKNFKGEKNANIN